MTVDLASSAQGTKGSKEIWAEHQRQAIQLEWRCGDTDLRISWRRGKRGSLKQMDKEGIFLMEDPIIG